MPRGVYDHHKVREDLTGKRFGRLNVLQLDHSNDGAYWLCQCDCGNTTVVKSYSLTSGHTQSCGCWNREIVSQTNKGKRKLNKFSVHNDIVTVVFSNCNETFICDVSDWEMAKNETWSKSNVGYPMCSAKKYFHQWILDIPPNMVCDHINRNKLDNRRCNLRVVSQAINAQNKDRKRTNKTGYSGVYKKKNGKYVGRFTMNQKKYYVGTFTDPRFANEAVKKMKQKMNYGGIEL